VTAILSPVTIADVERYAAPFLPAYVAAEEDIADREANGRHLQAAAGRAIHGAWWAAAVASRKCEVTAGEDWLDAIRRDGEPCEALRSRDPSAREPVSTILDSRESQQLD
jgi:hypothetical protein